MENAEPSHIRRRSNSTRLAQGSQVFLLLSLSLNVLLLLFSIPTGRESAAESRLEISQHNNAPPASERISAKPISIWSDSGSPWKQLESADLSIYADNLRAAGCPAKTVRNILLPLAEGKFEPVFKPANVWASFSQRQAAASARAQQEIALRHEKDKVLTELFGFAWTSEGLKQAYAPESARSIGFLEYDHAEKFLCLADRYKTQGSRLDGTDRIARRSTIYQAWLQEVSEVLSLAELEESELRQILVTWQRRNPIPAGLSGSELRQLMSFRRELFHPIPSALFSEEEELFQETDWAEEQRFNSKARSLLGDDRFLEYLQSGDVSMQRTLAALKEENLEQRLALELFDFRQEAMTRAQEIRERPGRRAEKRAQLAALRQNVLEQLAALSKGGIDSPLVEVNRDWLQEIANP